MRHLLVTNDFPPKVGGIQSYLWELWRRLPSGDVTVLTTAWPGAAAFDEAQAFRIERIAGRIMWPTPGLLRRVHALAAEVGADLVVLDPAIPLGLIGPRLEIPYAVVLHGSELLGRIPGGSRLMGGVVRSARTVVAAGGFPAAEAVRVGGTATPPIVEIPPGVDAGRFRPLDPEARAVARARFGLPPEAPVVLGLSRLVRRKGFDVVIAAAASLASHHPDLVVAIAGAGRDERRLRGLADAAPIDVRLLGRVSDADLPELYAVADVFCMLCHDRWLGLETEGFGIVFLEAAACGVPQVAGSGGGSADAVVDGQTGFVVDRPREVAEAAGAIQRLLQPDGPRREMSAESRRRAAQELDYDVLAMWLAAALEGAART